MPKFCSKCGNQAADNAKFCNKCGNNFNVSYSSVASQPASVSAASHVQKRNNKKKKSRRKAVIALTVTVLLLVAVALGAMYVYYYIILKPQDRLEMKLRKKTDKEIVDMYYDDFNSDGTGEMFAIVGKGGKDNFSQAEIWFLTEEDEPETIKEDFSGKVNGTLEQNDKKYVSVEVYDENNENNDEDTDKKRIGSSYIYGVDEQNDSYEHDDSGKYSDVHQKDDNIVGKDSTGKEKVLDLDDDKNESDNKTKDDSGSESIETFLQPTEEEFNELSAIGSTIYQFESGKTSYSDAFDTIVCDILGGLYWHYFDVNSQNNRVIMSSDSPDPLKKFVSGTYNCYYKLPEENVDWIMKNVLNYSVDHNSSSKHYYYKDGYYYRGSIITGDVVPYSKILSADKLNDGRYVVGLGFYMSDPSEATKVTRTITAGLKEVDGKRVWSIYKVESTD